MNKSVFIAFLGNYNFDTRTKNLTISLRENGYDVEGVFFDWFGSSLSVIDKKLPVYSLSKKISSVFFYLKFSVVLCIKLLFSKASYFFAEDVYTLPFTVFFAKLKRKKVIYDSRELFAHLAALAKKNKIQFVLQTIEKHYINQVDLVLVTGAMDAKFITDEYKIENIMVVRNLPLIRLEFEHIDLRTKYNIPADFKILFYQGIVVHGRGLTFAFNLLYNVPKTVLLIAGDGEKKSYYEELAFKNNIADRVKFIGRLDQGTLLNYTSSADLGLCIIENLSLSYYYALPNKLFEYIMAKLPVVVSNLPQMEDIVVNTKTGIVIDLEKEKESIIKISDLLNSENSLSSYRANCTVARNDLNWQKEIKHLMDWFI